MKINTTCNILIALLQLVFCSSFAQVNQKSLYNADTLTSAESEQLYTAFLKSTFGSFGLADSCSKSKDSICAGSYFLKVDPYILFFENVTPLTIDSFLIQNFLIPAVTSKIYTDLFTKEYLAPKTQTYNNFKRMGDEDRQIRKRFEECKDTICAAEYSKKMSETDKIHADFLYRYVKEKGWPSLANGSMYASLLAIHDHKHHNEYIPLLKDAVMKGRAELSVLNLILYWNAHSDDYSAKVKEHIKKGKYQAIDVSSMLNNQPISYQTRNRIIDVIKKHCPVKFIYIYESHDINIHKKWCSKIIPRNMEVMSQLSVDLASYNCNITKVELSGLQTGCWATYWQPSDHIEPKLIMYIMYDRNDSVYASTSFNKLITEKKFVTHAINFDVDKSTIKPGSLEFIKQLADWLKQNSAITLEINGHTDSDGDPAANQKLSQARAEEVKKQLVANGIAASRLTTKGFGDTKPIDLNNTEPGKANNRRVEFIKQ